MTNVQLTLDKCWANDRIQSKYTISSTENEIQMSSLNLPPSLSTLRSEAAACEAENEVGSDVEVEDGGERENVVGSEVEDGAERENEVEVEDGAEREIEGGFGDEVQGDGDFEHELELEHESNNDDVGFERESNNYDVGFDRESYDNVEVVYEELLNKSANNTHDLNCPLSIIVKGAVKKKPTSTRTKHRTQYLSAWEKKDEAQFKTYVFDSFGAKHERFSCWLYLKDEAMRCNLCEKHGKARNSNGKDNVWCNIGMTTVSLDKIKLHKEKSEVHKQAEEQELIVSCRTQPDWHTTQQKEISKQEQAILNLILSCVYLCQQDHPLNDIEPLCVLMEKLGVNLLPAEIPGVSYRNDTAALCFIQHIAHYLHKELVDKVKQSHVIGWMMDESTSRTNEKSCIIYVRYVDNFQPKTCYYGLLDLEGDGTAFNIVKALTCMWNNDDLDPTSSCWLATDNASTFTGIHEGVIAKLRRQLSIDWLDLNPCVAHSFALVGSQASYLPKTIDKPKPVLYDSIVKLESTIGQIYSYFSRSTNHQFKLKSWQSFLEMPELKFKRIFDIRWLSLRGCIKPIVDNVQPGSQALLVCLQDIISDDNSSKLDCKNSRDLLDCILNDEFLYSLHMHYDLHETVLGPITKNLQQDNLSYFNLMEMIAQKRKILSCWSSELTVTMGPTLCDYIELTKSGSFGDFNIKLGNRDQFLIDCRQYIERLIKELDKRFKPSMVQESLSTLFNPQYLITNKKKVDSSEYGRSQLDFLRRKYKNFPGFDSNSVKNEWESFKCPLVDFIESLSSDCPEKLFWRDFVELKQSVNKNFMEEYKNVLLLLDIYLICPTNSAECERGFSAINRIQTVGRSRLMIPTLNVLMTVRMLLKDDLRSVRCQQVIEKAFMSWNKKESYRRFGQVRVLADLSDNYQPAKQKRSVPKRSLSLMQLAVMNKKTKRPKSNSIRCANGCKASISETDPIQQGSTQCSHQNYLFSWIDQEKNCSRWLCYDCQVKLNITVDSIWLCSDHVDMHIDQDENDNID